MKNKTEGGIHFVLHPGTIRSATDGDIHWINATRLAGLYGVPLSKCTIAGRPDSRGYQERCGDIHLYPREDGDYRLPEEATMKAKVCKEDNPYQNESRDKHKHEYVVCIMADSKRTLTLGKTYKVERREHCWITVINDHGKEYSFLKHRFGSVSTNKPPISATICTAPQPLSPNSPEELKQQGATPVKDKAAVRIIGDLTGRDGLGVCVLVSTVLLQGASSSSLFLGEYLCTQWGSKGLPGTDFGGQYTAIMQAHAWSNSHLDVLPIGTRGAYVPPEHVDKILPDIWDNREHLDIDDIWVFKEDSKVEWKLSGGDAGVGFSVIAITAEPENKTTYELDPLTGTKVHPVTKQPIETYVDFSKIKIF